MDFNSLERSTMGPEISYGWGLLIEHLPFVDVLNLRLLCYYVLLSINSRIHKHRKYAFRIPYGETLKTISSAQSLIIHSQHSLHNTPPLWLTLIVSSPQHCNALLSTLPSNLIELQLVHFNEPTTNLHPSLTHFYSADAFNLPLNPLPPTLTHLITGRTFNQSVDSLPETLTHLTLGYYFNQTLENLPQSLTHLITGTYFNQRVDHLPPNLASLVTGCWFNRYIDRLPSTLKHLTTSHCFDKPVDQLPPQLTHLTVGYIFNQPVDRLPSTLLQLTTGFCFNKPTDCLPSNAIHIKHQQGLPPVLDYTKPAALLDFSAINLTSLPAALKILVLPAFFNGPLHQLPVTLTHLTTGRYFNQPLNNLPATLIYLRTGYYFQQPLINLPTTLTTIIVNVAYSSLVPCRILHAIRSSDLGDVPEARPGVNLQT